MATCCTCTERIKPRNLSSMSTCSLVIAKYAKEGSLDQSRLNLTVGTEASSFVKAFGPVENIFKLVRQLRLVKDSPTAMAVGMLSNQNKAFAKQKAD